MEKKTPYRVFAEVITVIAQILSWIVAWPTRLLWPISRRLLRDDYDEAGGFLLFLSVALSVGWWMLIVFQIAGAIFR